jgi:hypothetical protein
MHYRLLRASAFCCVIQSVTPLNVIKAGGDFLGLCKVVLHPVYQSSVLVGCPLAAVLLATTLTMSLLYTTLIMF